jgi:nucleoside-diphosphate kinase
MERTLVLIKPDGVKRGLIGAIIKKFETAGLKVVAIKMIKPDAKMAQTHYPEGPQWKDSWERTKKGYAEKGIPYNETLEQMTKRLRSGLLDYITDQPIIALVIEGNEAISCVRKITGATSPERADPSSIRGMYSTDSYTLADNAKRSVKNLIHASDSVKSANAEIAVWFSKKEIVEYKRADEDAIY